MAGAFKSSIPPQLIIGTNAAECWKVFRQRVEIHLKATKSNNEDDEIKIAILLDIGGEQAISIFNTLKFDKIKVKVGDEEVEKDESEIFEKVLEKFELYFNPRRNIVYERYKFLQRGQHENEAFDAFLADILKLVKSCEYMDEQNQLRDRIVLGVQNKRLQAELLDKDQLTFEKAVDRCRTFEVNQKQTNEVQSSNNGRQIDAIQRQQTQMEVRQNSNDSTNNFKKFGGNYQNYNQRNNNFNSKNKLEKNYNKVSYNNRRDSYNLCSKCNRCHTRNKCPAYSVKCHNCNKVGHFAQCCFKKKCDNVGINENSKEQMDRETHYLLQIETKNSKEWIEYIEIEDCSVQCKIDTGADINILPIKVFEEINRKSKLQLERTDIILECFGGFKVKPIGKVNLIINCKGQVVMQIFIIVPNEGARSIVGLTTAKLLGLVKIKTVNVIEQDSKGKFIEQNRDVFTGIGCMPGECSIKIKPNAIPVKKPARRIPIKITEEFEKALAKLESQDIISKVNQPVEWINNLVIIEKKNKKLRICLDPQELNRVIVIEEYPIPSLEEFTMKLNGKKWFTTLDMEQGFYQVKLSKESSFLCSFSTIFGVYKFNRLPFGLSMSPQYFQKLNMQNFGDIPGVFVYIDDISIVAETEEEHDRILERVMERARELNIRFNKEKIQYKAEKIKYLGHIFSKDGVSLDPERIIAIEKIDIPKDHKKLQSILGMINYLRSFIPNLAEYTTSLRELLKKKNEFRWNESLSCDLENIKKLIKSSPVLGIFDKTKPVVVQTDASKNGLGAVLLQEGRPISYASRCLSTAEQNYAQIEKELLAIVFGCKKFHNYIYGYEFSVNTDHQPLVSLFKKPITASHGSRIQRMRLKLIMYKISLSFVPGKRLIIADLLSRSNPKVEDCEIEQEDLSEIIHTINVSKEKETLFVKETNKDPVLNKVKEFIISGWPKNQDRIDDMVRVYSKVKNELYIDNEIIFYNDRIVVPKSLRKEMLNSLHEGHVGITKTRERAKSLLFWPNINQDITNMVLSCQLCERYRGANIREPLKSHEVPIRPFECVGCDIGELGNLTFLVIIDYFSKWMDIVMLNSKTAVAVIEALKTNFSTHGIPKKLICDNMPFLSYEFKRFSNDWNFEVVTSSPGYPQSNGMSERAIQIAKNMIRKSSDWKASLLEYRNTTMTDVGLSPAEILMGRRLRSRIPVKDKLLDTNRQRFVRNKLVERNGKSQYYYNRHVRDRKEFQVGDKIVYRDGKKWNKAIIIEKHKAPRSYLIKNLFGRILRRTSFHLRKSYDNNNNNKQSNFEYRTSNDEDQNILSIPSRNSDNLIGGNENVNDIDNNVNIINNTNIINEDIGNRNEIEVNNTPSLRRTVRVRNEPFKFKDYIKY